MASQMMQWNEVDDNPILLWPSQTMSLLFYYIWALLTRGVEKLGGIIRTDNENGNGFKLCHSRHIKVNGGDTRVNRKRRLIFVVIWETGGKKWHSTLCLMVSIQHWWPKYQLGIWLKHGNWVNASSVRGEWQEVQDCFSIFNHSS